VATVLVDEITSTADVTKNSIMVIGRSPARDIIDSTWTEIFPTQLKLKDLVNKIGEKFGITCGTFEHEGVDDPTTWVYSFGIQGESPWIKLIAEADNQGFILTSNEIGNLYLWRVQAALREEPFNITEGVNIKNIRWTENGAEQFHEYIVTGGGYEKRVIDSSCPGNRVLTIDIPDEFIARDKVDRRAETEMRRRKETKITVTVPGWGLTDEQIRYLGNTNGKEIFWFPNSLIPVKVPSMGINTNLLLSEIEYSATPETSSSDLTLVNREAYL
jgi:prophage tail gpP-like protein